MAAFASSVVWLLGINKIVHLKDQVDGRKKLLGKIGIGLCMLLELFGFGVYTFLRGLTMDALGQIGLFPGLTGGFMDYHAELRRYFSTVVYLFNTAFGLVLSLIGMGFLAFKRRAALDMALAVYEISALDDWVIVCLVGYIGAFHVVTACTTACSISLEGKNLWLIQSLPVSGFQVLLSKLMVNWTLTFPTSLFIGLGVGWTLSLSVLDTVSVTVMLIDYSIISVSISLLVNLKSHRFDWTTEDAVVKQSESVGISMLTAMALIALPVMLTFIFMDYAKLTFSLASIFAVGIGLGIMAMFRRRGDRWLNAL